jgi:hypothetical protein
MAALTQLPSDRRFGLTFCVILLALGVYAAVEGLDRAAYLFLFAASVAFGSVAATAPRALAPFNRLWFRFGMLLGRVVSPVILSIIFFGLLTPIAYAARLFGRDELHLRRRAVPSYWIDRNPPGPTGQSFKKQF